MTDVVREALVASIEKWKRKAAFEDIFDTGPESCPLCQLFFMDNCMGCPVFEATSLECCDGSPYWSYSNYVIRRHSEDDGFYENVERLAQAEVDFLKELLIKHDKSKENDQQ